jgi:hypothetical protein
MSRLRIYGARCALFRFDHTTDTPHDMTYASVVSRESVRIDFNLAALNDLNVKMADI